MTYRKRAGCLALLLILAGCAGDSGGGKRFGGAYGGFSGGVAQGAR